jgi:hypothetical protein
VVSIDFEVSSMTAFAALHAHSIPPIPEPAPPTPEPPPPGPDVVPPDIKDPPSPDETDPVKEPGTNPPAVMLR